MPMKLHWPKIIRTPDVSGIYREELKYVYRSIGMVLCTSLTQHACMHACMHADSRTYMYIYICIFTCHICTCLSCLVLSCLCLCLCLCLCVSVCVSVSLAVSVSLSLSVCLYVCVVIICNVYVCAYKPTQIVSDLAAPSLKDDEHHRGYIFSCPGNTAR